MLKDCIKGNVDILLTTKTKLDEFFPNVQFQTDGFSNPYRRSTENIRGGILLYVRKDIPSKLASFKMRAFNSFS